MGLTNSSLYLGSTINQFSRYESTRTNSTPSFKMLGGTADRNNIRDVSAFRLGQALRVTYEAARYGIDVAVKTFKNAISNNSEPSKSPVHVIQVSGSYFEMGQQYGMQLKPRLESTLFVLNDFFDEHNVTHDQVVSRAFKFSERYSSNYLKFLQGISNTTGISYDDVQVLNGQETLASLVSGKDSLTVECAFLAIPPSKSSTGKNIIGRNYDFPPPFDKVAQNVVVTVMNGEGLTPTATIGLPGQIYCPSCVNSNNIYYEFNNGEPSGGYTVDYSRKSLLISLLEIAQDSVSLEDTKHALFSTESDYSLIANIANESAAVSFEFSSTLGMKPFFQESGSVQVSTNFYLNSTWQGIPEPTDNSTWEGLTRRNNLLNLTAFKHEYSLNDVLNLMNVSLADGGAKWNLTIYQQVYDTSNQTLYVRSPNYDDSWTQINLKDLFQLSDQK